MRRRAPAAGTFFSLHFLALGVLLFLLMEDVIKGYLDTVWDFAANLGFVDAVLDFIVYVANTGAALFDLCELALEYLTLCVVVSGPPLLLTGIGQILARRCAATLPRRRFRALTCLVSLGFVGVDLSFSLTPRPFENEQEVAIDFQVVDRDSGQPIATAFLRMTDAFTFDRNAIPPRALTDASGRA